MTYTHRNGETEPPTIPGDFWYKGKLHHRGHTDESRNYHHDCGGMFHIYPHWHTNKLCIDGEECIHYMEDAEGQWWGPVVPPWDRELNQKPITEEDGRRWAKQFCQMFVEVHVPRLAREIAEELAEFDKEQRGSRPRSKA